MTADPREVIGLAAGRALAQAEDDDGYTDWAEWHACPDPPTGARCPRCGCAGAPFLAAPLLDAIMEALAAAGIRLIVPEEAGGG